VREQRAVRKSFALRAASVDTADVDRLVEAGMSRETAGKVLGEGKTVDQALELLSKAIAREAALGRSNSREEIEEGEAGIGAKSDAVGLLYVDVEGEYVDDGYVDDTPQPFYRQASGNSGKSTGFFGGLFGGNDEEKAAKRALAAQRERDMNVITFVDPDAKPGLMHKRPSYFDPEIVGSEKNALGLYSSSQRQGSGPQSSVTRQGSGPKSSVTAAPPTTPPPPLAKAALAEGWYAANDEATGKEYYYNAEGAVTWERPQ